MPVLFLLCLRLYSRCLPFYSISTFFFLYSKNQTLTLQKLLQFFSLNLLACDCPLLLLFLIGLFLYHFIDAICFLLSSNYYILLWCYDRTFYHICNTYLWLTEHDWKKNVGKWTSRNRDFWCWWNYPCTSKIWWKL